MLAYNELISRFSLLKKTKVKYIKAKQDASNYTSHPLLTLSSSLTVQLSV